MHKKFIVWLLCYSGFIFAADQFSVQEIVNDEATKIFIKNELDIAIKVKMINHLSLTGTYEAQDKKSLTDVTVFLLNPSKWMTIKPSRKIQFKGFPYLTGATDITQKGETVLLVRAADKELRQQKKNLRFKGLNRLIQGLNKMY